MGGSWNGWNKCWESCYNRSDYVVNRLVELVNQMDLDGIDINYEYFYENNQNNLGFTKGKFSFRRLQIQILAW